MEAIRRVGFLFFVLVIGIFLGTLGLRLEIGRAHV